MGHIIGIPVSIPVLLENIGLGARAIFPIEARNDLIKRKYLYLYTALFESEHINFSNCNRIS